MKVKFRDVYHIPLEIYMSHKYWFPPCHGADTISATANADGGFTTLTAICGRYGWSHELIKKASKECNLAGEVAIVTEVKPTLLLVPKTNGKEDVTYLIEDLIEAANEIGTKILNFTHYGFSPRKKYPRREWASIFHTMTNHRTKSTIQEICWDVDYRRRESLINIMYEELCNKSAYTVGRIGWAEEYHYNCSRCQQDFVLDPWLGKLITEGETEVEIALCHDCQKKLCRNEWFPFYSPKPKELCH